MIDEDARYVDIDEEGRIFAPKQYPKWTKPGGKAQAMVLKAVGRTRYHNRDEQSAVNEVAKGSLSLKEAESEYPLEWIEFCCNWAIAKREKQQLVQLKGLLTFIKDKDKNHEWLDRNRKNYERGWDDLANQNISG